MFSGKTFKEEEIADAINDCKNEVKKLFPGDNDPKIKTVLIGVSD